MILFVFDISLSFDLISAISVSVRFMTAKRHTFFAFSIYFKYYIKKFVFF